MGILRSGAKNTGHPTGRLVRDGPQPHVDITHHFLGPALTDPRLVPAAVPHLAQPADQDAPSLSSGKHAHDLVVTASCPDNPGGTVVLDAIDDVTTTHQYVARHDHHLVHRHDVLVLDRWTRWWSTRPQPAYRHPVHRRPARAQELGNNGP